MLIAFYCRVSSEEQVHVGSIQNQIDYCKKYCDLHQYQNVTIYADEGVTGTLPIEARDAGARLFEDARAGKINLLLLYRLDRLGRSPRIILNAIHELEECGVEVRSMTEPIDTSTPAGRLFITMLSGFAGFERESILERTRLGKARAAREARWSGGQIPFGYTIDAQKKLVICDNQCGDSGLTESEVVRLIFSLVSERLMTSSEVANHLNALRVPLPSSREGKGKRKIKTSGLWRNSGVVKIIHNPIYLGRHIYGLNTDDEIEVNFPAIVSEEVWDAAQLALQSNFTGSKRNAKREYLLRGVLRCGSCGGSVTGETLKGAGGVPITYYKCAGKRNKIEGLPFCSSPVTQGKWIEEGIWQKCLHYIANPHEASLSLERLYADSTKDKTPLPLIQDEQKQLKKSLSGLENEKARVIELFSRRMINTADVEKQLKRISGEHTRFEKRLADLGKVMEPSESAIPDMLEVLKTLSDLVGDGADIPDDLRRSVIQTLVKRVVVFSEKPDVRADIEFVFGVDTIIPESVPERGGFHGKIPIRDESGVIRGWAPGE